MAMLQWRPLNEIEKFLEDHVQFGSQIIVDLYEEKDSLIAQVHIPGIEQDHVDILVRDHTLRIVAYREKESEDKEKNYYYKEIKRGKVERLISLPTWVVSERAQAEFHNGVLKVVLPKQHANDSGSHKIKIQSNQKINR